MKSAKSSVSLLLWSEQTISHLRVSYFMLLYQMRCLEKLRNSIKNVTVNWLFLTVRANLFSWQWLGSFSKVVRTLCPTKGMTGRFLVHVFNGIDSFLNTFAKLRKATSFVMSVRPSPWNNSAPTGGFSYNLSIFQKSVEKFQVALRPGKDNGHCIWRPMHVCDNISPDYSSNKCFRQKL